MLNYALAAVNILTPINIFVVSMFVVAWSGPWLVVSLTRIAKYLGWREFVVAFIMMAFVASLPNFFIGVTSAFRGIPELSFGDVSGNNLVALTLAVALAVLLSGRAIPAEGSTLQLSALFSVSIAILPLLLILDGNLSRADGILLIFVFIFYIVWLFSKGDRFRQVYSEKAEMLKASARELPEVIEFKDFLRALGSTALGAFLLVAGADGVVWSASYFADALNLSIPVIGILLVGSGNALPEIYFAISAAKKGQTDMILGNLMGSVMVPASLVLGLVVLINPIENVDLSPFAIARFFLILSAGLFYLAARTGKKITKKEAFVLLGVYITFVLVEILAQ